MPRFHLRLGRILAAAGHAGEPRDARPQRVRALFPVVFAAVIGAVWSLSALFVVRSWDIPTQRDDCFAAPPNHMFALGTTARDLAWLALFASLLIGGAVVLQLRRAGRPLLAPQRADERDSVRFGAAELDREASEREAISDHLRGLERNEFELYYQPQVDVVSGRIIGVEALLRWNHPTRGFLTPAAFIAIAEGTGSIVALGEWAFDQACRQMRSWSDRGIAPPVLAVNFSAVQFKAATDVDARIAASLEKWGVNPTDVEIELTESVLCEVNKKHRDIFERLRKLGVRIAIDDFGTGYCSLSYLSSYPVNRLKIAQELVMGINDDARKATVVRAAIHLAKELGIECIAEGVENAGQAELLVSAGCEHVQGFYFAAPIPADRMTELLVARVVPHTPSPSVDPSMPGLVGDAPAIPLIR
ncbi:MAG: putative bifunctional diguanylate cyclase/phosphodiesterase [Xanthobacteraceae bacterium]